jgi:hypothetical protein
VFTVTGSPTQAFVDALRAALVADTTLMALVTGVFGHVSEAARTAYPYLVLGHRSRTNDGGAMQLAGGQVTVQLDVWSDHKGGSEAHAIQSRVAALLERKTLPVTGFAMVEASLTCEFEDVVIDPDDDNPKVSLYHGVQRWAAQIEER